MISGDFVDMSTNLIASIQVIMKSETCDIWENILFSFKNATQFQKRL